MLFLWSVYKSLSRFTSLLNTSNFFSYHWLFTMMVDNNVKTSSYLTIKKNVFKTSLEELLTLYSQGWDIARLSEPELTRFPLWQKDTERLLLEKLRLHVPVCSELLLWIWAKMTPLESYPQAAYGTIFDDFWVQSYSLWAYGHITKICSPSLSWQFLLSQELKDSDFDLSTCLILSSPNPEISVRYHIFSYKLRAEYT